MLGEMLNRPSETETKPADSESLNWLQLMPDMKTLSTREKVAVGLGFGLVAAGSAYLLLHGRGGASAEAGLVNRLDGFARQLNDLIETGKSPYITSSSHVSTELTKPFDGYYRSLETVKGRSGLVVSGPYPGGTRVEWENLKGAEVGPIGPIQFSVGTKLSLQGWTPFKLPASVHEAPRYVKVNAT